MHPTSDEKTTRAAQVRAGTELTPCDVAGLKAALDTPEGRAQYDYLIGAADRTHDAERRDELIYLSLHFWKDGEKQAEGRNNFSSAHYSRHYVVDSEAREYDGTPYSLYDTSPDLSHATAGYDNDSSRWRNFLRGNLRASAVTRIAVGPRDASPTNECPSGPAAFGSDVRLMIDAADARGILPQLFLTLYFWKIEAPSYATLTAREAGIWGEVVDASRRLECQDGEATNIRTLGTEVGIKTFVPNTFKRALTRALASFAGIGEDSVLPLLRGDFTPA